MKRLSLVALIVLFFAPVIPSQSGEQEPQTMQAVLVEIRELRRDLQLAANGARRAQIVIYRLHEQRQVVEHVTERAENAKTTLEQIQNQLRYDTEQLKEAEESRERSESDASQKQQLDNWIAQIKTRMEMAAAGSQEWQSKQLDAETELHAERQKLERLEDELDLLSRDLDSSPVEAARSGRN